MSVKQEVTTNAQTPDVLTSKETKQILTPFAFEIDKTLFGLPLAKPWKRGAALFIDFLLIALLAETPGELLVFVVALTLFRVGSKKRAKKAGKRRGLRKLFLRLLGAVILFILLLSAVPDFVDEMANKSSKVNDEKPVISIEEKDKKVFITDQQQINEQDSKKGANVNSVETNSIVYKGIEWTKGVIKDLGLSFGWAAFYFTVLTAIWNGQTPGKRFLKVRVIQLDGTPLSIWDSFGRYGGYGAGLATGLLGFLQIYWDANRQAIHDKISATIVIDVKN